MHRIYASACLKKSDNGALVVKDYTDMLLLSTSAIEEDNRIAQLKQLTKVVPPHDSHLYRVERTHAEDNRTSDVARQGENRPGAMETVVQNVVLWYGGTMDGMSSNMPRL